jgi:ATP-dependent Lhr-like helicase
MVLLRRYGVVFYNLMAHETAMPRWRELLGMFRRLEARGTVRGGRFVSGFGGEQFALPEALETLRRVRSRKAEPQPVTFAAADPMNLVGIVIPGEREASVPGRTVTYPVPAVAEEFGAIEGPAVSRDLLPFGAAPLEGSALA